MKAPRSTASSAPPPDDFRAAIQRRAAEWLALRGARALTAKEEGKLAAWLAADVRHAEIFTEVEAAWHALDRLGAYPRVADAAIDPDLLAPARRHRSAFVRFAPFAVAAAAALVVAGALAFRWPARIDSEAPPSLAPHAQAGTRFLTLPDGSVVELKADSVVVPDFTAPTRRVRLVRGEAHFSVTKDPARPFIVEAEGVDVRAVGTAFNVRLAPQAVEVLVTEGTVHVAPPSLVARADPGAAPATATAASTAINAGITVTIGQRTVVSTAPLPATHAGRSAAPAPPTVETLTAAAIDRALAWQSTRFAFDDTPLAEVVARFNRQTEGRADAPRLVVPEPALGSLRISGRIRADNVENFVEVLESTFGVVAERRPGEIVLRAAGRP